MSKQIAENKYQVVRDYIIVFLICFIPRLILASFAKPLRTQSDEFSTMFFAAKLAGLQWDEVQEYANYYGFGMNFFTWWIFKLPVSSVVKYKCLLAFCGVLQSLVGVVCLKIQRVLDIPQIKGKIRVGIAVVCSFMVFTRNTVYYNEHALILITWIIALLVVNLIMNATKKHSKLINSIVLAFVLAFAFLVHARSLTYVLALIMLELFYFIFYKKSLIHIRGLLGVFAVGYLGAQSVLSWYQGSFWTEGHRVLSNASVPDVSGVLGILTSQTFITMVQVFFSQFATASILTGGVFFIAIVVLVMTLFKEFFLKREKLKGSERAVFMIGLYTLMCAVATSLFQCLSWGPGVAYALYEGGDLYSLKALTYIRYIGPYVGVIFFAGLLFVMVQEYSKVKPIYMASLALFAVVVLLWNNSIVPILALSPVTNEAFICFVLEEITSKGEVQYWVGTIIALTLAGIFLLLLKEKRKWIVCILGLLLMYQYMYNAVVYDIQTEEKRYQTVNASYELFCNLEEEGILVGKDLYVVDEKRSDDHMFFFPFQIYMEDYIVHPTYPKDGENVVLITNKYRSTEKNFDIEKYTSFRLDDNEVIFTNNDILIEFLRTHGYREL